MGWRGRGAWVPLDVSFHHGDAEARSEVSGGWGRRHAQGAGEKLPCRGEHSEIDSMILIACLHPRGCRTLIADTLITSPKPPRDGLVFPTRIYVPPHAVQNTQFRPTALRRKVIEISPNLVALWAGSSEEVRRFADRVAACFAGRDVGEDDLERFLSDDYSEHIPNFHAIIAPADQDWLYSLGDVDSSFSSFAGHYFVAGTGKQLFRDMVDRATPREDSNPLADIDALRIANDLMMQEIVTGGPTQDAFGGAYEMLYHGPTGFERVNDVLHCFTLARVYVDRIDIIHYPHVTRQWYEHNQLCIASLSTPEAHEQGIEFMMFGIPSIIEPGHTRAERPLESLAERPAYMCIHHLFDIGGQLFPSVMTMRGEAVDQMFKMSLRNGMQTFEHTYAYTEELHKQAAQLVQRGTSG